MTQLPDCLTKWKSIRCIVFAECVQRARVPSCQVKLLLYVSEKQLKGHWGFSGEISSDSFSRLWVRQDLISLDYSLSIFMMLPAFKSAILKHHRRLKTFCFLNLITSHKIMMVLTAQCCPVVMLTWGKLKSFTLCMFCYIKAPKNHPHVVMSTSKIVFIHTVIGCIDLNADPKSCFSDFTGTFTAYYIT